MEVVFLFDMFILLFEILNILKFGSSLSAHARAPSLPLREVAHCDDAVFPAVASAPQLSVKSREVVFLAHVVFGSFGLSLN